MSKLNRAYELIRSKKDYYEKRKLATMDLYYQEDDDERSERIYRDYEYYKTLCYGLELALSTIEAIKEEG